MARRNPISADNMGNVNVEYREECFPYGIPVVPQPKPRFPKTDHLRKSFTELEKMNQNFDKEVNAGYNTLSDETFFYKPEDDEMVGCVDVVWKVNYVYEDVTIEQGSWRPREGSTIKDDGGTGCLFKPTCGESGYVEFMTVDRKYYYIKKNA